MIHIKRRKKKLRKWRVRNRKKQTINNFFYYIIYSFTEKFRRTHLFRLPCMKMEMETFASECRLRVLRGTFSKHWEGINTQECINMQQIFSSPPGIIFNFKKRTRLVSQNRNFQSIQREIKTRYRFTLNVTTMQERK